jgi:transposase-like protein
MPADLARVTRNVDIVEAVLSGQSVDEIAAAHGITDRQVYRILKDDDYRKIVEQGQREQVFLLPKANKRLARILDNTEDETALKAIKVVQQNTGVAPSHTQPVYIGQILNQQVNVLDPNTSKLLCEFMASRLSVRDDD